ncbi:MAG: hypothetical protein ACOWWO_17825 [Peptococcaceae bacterium]
MRKPNETVLYVSYIVAVSIVIVLDFLLNQYIANQLQLTYNIKFPLYLLKLLSPMIIGAFLGLEHIIRELKEIGKWDINKRKLLIIGGPSLIISLFPLIPFLGIYLYEYNTFFMYVHIIADTKFFQIVFGYTMITSFKK